MKDFEDIAVRFAQALVAQDWDGARSLLLPPMQSKWSATELEQEFKSMFQEYADGPATSIHFDPQFSMEAWPAKQPDDVGWAYVSIQGDDFVEAVTVIVSSSANRLGIREVEWGRP